MTHTVTCIKLARPACFSPRLVAARNSVLHTHSPPQQPFLNDRMPLIRGRNRSPRRNVAVEKVGIFLQFDSFVSSDPRFGRTRDVVQHHASSNQWNPTSRQKGWLHRSGQCRILNGIEPAKGWLPSDCARCRRCKGPESCIGMAKHNCCEWQARGLCRLRGYRYYASSRQDCAGSLVGQGQLRSSVEAW